MRECQLGENNPNYGKDRPHSEETKRKIAESMEEYMKENYDPTKTTSIELKTKDYLEEESIEYTHQKSVGKFLVDFYLPNHDLIIECDGCFWHNCPKCGFDDGENRTTERDKRKNQLVKQQNKNLIRIWEHSFKDNEYKKIIDNTLQRISKGQEVFLDTNLEVI